MDRAHRIVLQSLAPEVILREDIGLLRKLLADLENARIVDWHKGGQVSVRFMRTGWQSAYISLVSSRSCYVTAISVIVPRIC